MNKVIFSDWGLIDYKEAWDMQEMLLKEKVEQKLQSRDNPSAILPKHDLIFCEHPHVYTLGKSGSEANLLLDEDGLKTVDAVFYKNNRGGDITYHGPGQIVGYPILDLEQFFTDIHKYLRLLEESIIQMLAHYSIQAGRYEGLTGVWLDAHKANARKICAMGVRCSRWVTMHGFALNVNTNLDYFKNIVPCGITDKDVTSMERELGQKVNYNEVKDLLKQEIAKQFEMELV